MLKEVIENNLLLWSDSEAFKYVNFFSDLVGTRFAIHDMLEQLALSIELEHLFFGTSIKI